MQLAHTKRLVGIRPMINVYSVLMFILVFFCYITVGLKLTEDNQGYAPLYLLMLIQITPFCFCFARQHYNYIAFVLFNHLFVYSVPKLNQLFVLDQYDTLTQIQQTAIFQLTICTLLIISVYYFCRYFLFHRFVEREKYQYLSMSRFQLMTVAMYVICVPLFLKHLPPWLISLHFATMAADMVLLLGSTSPSNDRLASILRFGVVVSTIWYFLETGFLAMVGNLAGYIFIAACLRRKYKMLIWPLLLALVASLVQNVKYSYRLEIWKNPTASMSDRMNLLSSLLYLQYVEGIKVEDASEEEKAEVDNVEQIAKGFSRVGDDSLERVLAMTPSVVPFWNGESYSALPYLFIPRAVWSDKPTRHIWNKFGRKYQVLSEDDYTTAVGVGFLAEGFMNFGYFGMYGIAVFFGFLVALVERLSYYILGGYFYFTYMVFLMPVMGYGNDLTSIIASIGGIGVLMVLFRGQLLRMARKDDYA